MNNQFILLLVLFVFVFIQCQDDKIQEKLDNTLWEVYQFNNLTDDHIDLFLYFNKDNLDIWDSYVGFYPSGQYFTDNKNKLYTVTKQDTQYFCSLVKLTNDKLVILKGLRDTFYFRKINMEHFTQTTGESFIN